MDITNIAVRLGKYDHKSGPICLNKTDYGECLITDKPCDDTIFSIIQDGLIIKRDHCLIEYDQFKYYIFRLGIEKPQMRGGFERYLLLVRIPLECRNVKVSILEKFQAEFKALFHSVEYEPSTEEFTAFQHQCEATLKSLLESAAQPGCDSTELED